MRLRAVTVASSTALVGAFLTREEALLWLGIAITVLQLIYDFYKEYSKNIERKSEEEPGQKAQLELQELLRLSTLAGS